MALQVYAHIFFPHERRSESNYLTSSKLSAFVDVLRTHLSVSAMEEQSVDSLLGQAMYFGQSLGRVGFDFRLLLVPVFAEVMLRRAADVIREAKEENHFRVMCTLSSCASSIEDYTFFYLAGFASRQMRRPSPDWTLRLP